MPTVTRIEGETAIVASQTGCVIGDRKSAEAKPTLKCWIAVCGSLLGAFMAVLDIQITNSSLKDIQGALAATPDEGAWISTSYLVAEIIVIPLTAWLSRVFSIRRYMLVNAVLFLIFSVLCAFSWDLSSMIFFRAGQGFTGGVLIPMSFSIILTTLPPSRQPMGLAMFAVTATFAPAIGPAIGGWLTEQFGWQYIFYLNIIPGAVLIAAVWYAIAAQPLQLNLLKGGDYWGILAMAVGLGSFTVFLEEGNRKDWFGDEYIRDCAIAAAVGLTAFVVIELTRTNPFLNLRLFARRNFGISSLVNFTLGVGLYGSVFILPLYLSQIQGYNAYDIGTVVAWSGGPQLLLIPLVPRFMKFVDTRVLVVIGMVLFGVSCLMNSNMTNLYGYNQLLAAQLVRACGQPLILVPLSSLATAGIEKENAGSASSLFNMLRNLGGSVGIAIIGTLLTRREKFHSSRQGEFINPSNPQVQVRLNSVERFLVTRGVAPREASAKAVALVDQSIRRESTVMAYNDCFFLMGSLLIAIGATILLCKPIRPGEGGGAAH
ncbi:MAG: multidrug efflux MFS transporter [Blastocatellia bacterium]|nr:multidrug efflux MFS transporter [Blastocatellia bacterium]